MTDDARPVWVLGGGGVAGIAWETGVLAGLADEGIAIDRGHIVLGTSAGAVVAAQVTAATSLEELYELQLENNPSLVSPSITASAMLKLATGPAFASTPEQAAKRIGRRALQARISDPDLMLRIIADRLPVHEWPDADLRITAVDTESGQLRVFTRADGVALVDAVAASSCIPFIMSPVHIEGRRYMDGGMRSPLNLDLAPGSGPVIALAPTISSMGPWARLSRQRAALGARSVEVVTRDEATRKAQGTKVMDRSVVPAVAAGGRAQGHAIADRLRVALAAE